MISGVLFVHWFGGEENLLALFFSVSQSLFTQEVCFKALCYFLGTRVFRFDWMPYMLCK